MSRVLGPTVIVTCRPSRASRRADGVASLLSAVKGDAPARSATGKDAGRTGHLVVRGVSRGDSFLGRQRSEV